MTLVKLKDHGMVKLVDDSKVPAMLAQGFEVLNQPESKPVPVEKPIGKMTVDELKAYAAEKGIELPEDGKKADLLAAIEAAEKGGAEDDKDGE